MLKTKLPRINLTLKAFEVAFGQFRKNQKYQKAIISLQAELDLYQESLAEAARRLLLAKVDKVRLNEEVEELQALNERLSEEVESLRGEVAALHDIKQRYQWERDYKVTVSNTTGL